MQSPKTPSRWPSSPTQSVRRQGCHACRSAPPPPGPHLRCGGAHVLRPAEQQRLLHGRVLAGQLLRGGTTVHGTRRSHARPCTCAHVRSGLKGPPQCEESAPTLPSSSNSFGAMNTSSSSCCCCCAGCCALPPPARSPLLAACRPAVSLVAAAAAAAEPASGGALPTPMTRRATSTPASAPASSPAAARRSRCATTTS